jgi:hypothetical protein
VDLSGSHQERTHGVFHAQEAARQSDWFTLWVLFGRFWDAHCHGTSAMTTIADDPLAQISPEILNSGCLAIS